LRLRAVNTDVVKLDVETLVITFFEDERPLKGQAGLADWRLCGAVSQLIIDRRIDGYVGEKILFPMSHRMKCDKILAIGLGQSNAFGDEAYSRICRIVADSMFKLRCLAFSISLPGSIIEGFDSGAATARLCEEIGDRYRVDREMFKDLNLVILVDSQKLKDTVPIATKYELRFNEELRI
jgi:Cytosol aminopeptidase family, N-terminal domain